MRATGVLLGVSEDVGCLGNALELRLALEVEEDGGFFDMTVFEDAADDFVAMKWCGFLFEDVGDDIRDSALAIAPFTEGIDAASDEDEALVFDEFVVNCLSGDVFALEVRILDRVSDL